MKLTAILLLCACLHVAAHTNGQTVTLKLKDAPISELFHEIQKQTGLDVMVDEALIEKAGRISLEVKNMPVPELLTLCLKNQPLEYSIVDGRIVIKPSPQKPPAPPGEIHGRIMNAQGIPLVGANVIINRTRRGTQTNANGEFILKNVYPDDVLSISFIGYKTQTLKVDGGTNFPVVMEVTKNELDQVVVQAYGTTTQRLATGNIGTVTAAQIERQPVMNPLEALYGKVPGLVITPTSGYASGPVNVEIRGRANISGGPSDPLFIIDGVPMTLNGAGNGSAYGIIPVLSHASANIGPAQGQSPLFSINPQDIESISVLKDADATAIYGSRGANGVVIITTKKGMPGKTKFTASVYQGFSEVTQHYKILNTQQYLAMRHEALANDGITPRPGTDYDLLVWDTTRYTDWQKVLWGGKGKTTDFEADISGGDKQTTFRIGGNYHRATGILSYSGADQRAGIQINLNHKSLNQRLSTSFISVYSYTRSDLVSLPGNVTMAPNAPAILDANGKPNYAGWAPISARYPFSNLFQPYNAKTNFLNSSLDLRYQLFKSLALSASLGYGTTHLSNSQFSPILSQNPSDNPVGSAVFSTADNSRAIIEPKIEYKGIIGKIKLNALLGGSFQSTEVSGTNVVGTGYTNDKLLGSIGNAPSKTAEDGYFQYRYAAAFGRVTLNWEDKYILNLSARRDGSSRFGSGKQWGNFGAAGAAWIFTQENWFKKWSSFLSFGKIRASYGLTGNDVIGDYEYLTRWSAENNLPYGALPAYIPTQHANPTLHWETNRKLEAAIALGFLKDRITTELSWYRNLCGDQLVIYPLPDITGFPGVTANFPATVQNQGLELTFNMKLMETKSIAWSVSFSAGANKNKLLAFPGIEQTPYASVYTVGDPLNITKLLHYTGLDPQTGHYTFLDKNKDGQIVYGNDPLSDQYNKDLTIRLDGGFGTDFSFKGLAVNLYFNFRKQDKASAIYNGVPGKTNVNQSVQVLDHWQKPGDVAQFAKFSTRNSADYYNYMASDAIYSNGSYIRLRNCSIAYDLPSNLMNKARLQQCRIYLRAQNLFIITRYNGIDPDSPGLGSMPPQKTFIGGIQISL